MTYRIGVDIGGTFTDCVVVDEDTGAVRSVKVPTTPDDQSVGFMNAIDEAGFPIEEVSLILHGCTVGINAVLTRTGSKIGYLTTKGFRDVPAMGRGQRPSLDQFNPYWHRAFGDAETPFVPRYLRRGVSERIDRDGRVVVPLDTDELRREVEFLVSQGAEAVAVCFVNGYANDAHEREAHALVREIAPDLYCWTSTGVHPCFKEYPRFSTCTLNAYTGPLVDRYLDRTELLLDKRGYGDDLMVMQSNGGVLPAGSARDRAAYTLQSGPAGGVIAAQQWGERLGLENLVTLDIGGTSADYAIVQDGAPVLTTELEVEHDVLVALPAVNVHSIGAGGGSIAWIDRIGALRVGPQSAGAEPGPACYGRGGTEPTVTDAFAVLGVVRPEQFLDGSLPFYPDRARDALRPLADHLNVDLEEAAEAILDVAVANMVEAAREVSVYNGIDPRDFALYVYGAAGPLFASRIGRELGPHRIVIPPYPGEMSAYGLAMADLRLDVGEPIVQPLADVDPEHLTAVYERMEEHARATLPSGEVEVRRWIDGRYVGQTWETPSVPVPEGPLGPEEMEQVRRNFDDTHRRVWGYALERYGVKATMARITAIAPFSKPEPQRRSPGGEAEQAEVEVFLEGSRRRIPSIQRASLGPGERIEGPALITQPTSTVLLHAGDVGEADDWGNLWISTTGR